MTRRRDTARSGLTVVTAAPIAARSLGCVKEVGQGERSRLGDDEAVDRLSHRRSCPQPGGAADDVHVAAGDGLLDSRAVVGDLHTGVGGALPVAYLLQDLQGRARIGGDGGDLVEQFCGDRVLGARRASRSRTAP